MKRKEKTKEAQNKCRKNYVDRFYTKKRNYLSRNLQKKKNTKKGDENEKQNEMHKKR